MILKRNKSNLQIKEYLDKTRKFRRSSNHSHPHPNQPNQEFQKQLQHKSDDEDDDDDDDDDDQQDVIENNPIDEQHLTQKENNLNTLRQNFKCVQHSSTSIFNLSFYFKMKK